jgi:tRNA (guanine-N7-)-methyltransferase
MIGAGEPMSRWPVATAELWTAVFGDARPVEIEIGSGDGAFLLANAAREPGRSHLGIERSPAKVRRVEARLVRSGLTNVRILQGDATCLVTRLLPDASVAAYHVYFPDPWPKRGHATRRIFQPGFVAAVARTLVSDGQLYVATDVEGYARVARDRVLADAAFREHPAGAEHPGLTTSFARKYRAAGRPLFTHTFVRIAAGEEDQRFAASKTRSM